MHSRLLVCVSALVLGASGQKSPFRCRNKDPECEDWAKRGECDKNHDFMVAGGRLPVARLVCTQCPTG